MDQRASRSASLSQALLEWWTDQRTRQGRWPTLWALSRELCGFLRESTPERQRQRYGDVEYDWDTHANTTSATVDWRNRLLGVFHSPYQPTEPALFHQMMQSLPIDFAQFTFIDLGSGKGRTLLMASDYPFQKILGVELLPELHRVAEENVRNYRSPTQKCFAIEARCGDAREFVFPAQPFVLYLFNPLSATGLSSLMKNLAESLRNDPREAYVLYHSPLLEHVVTASGTWRRIGGTHQYSVYAPVQRMLTVQVPTSRKKLKIEG